MDDGQKPRRARAEELAEIAAYSMQQDALADARFLQELQRPPGQSLLLEIEQKEIQEEAELRDRETEETPFERSESERIKRAEAEIEAERPFLRQRELRKVQAHPSERRQAA
jgi:hypothetical protein